MYNGVGILVYETTNILGFLLLEFAPIKFILKSENPK